jgi:tetraacyldisaccharide 4'-kinase
MLKTPNFYYKKNIGILSMFLLPLSLIWWFCTCIKKVFAKKITLKNKTIICVGNATLGGAGKTPTCIFIGNLLKKEGFNFCFLSKGYGRTSKGFFKVSEKSDALEAGDEPLLLNRVAPTYVFSKWKNIIKNLPSIREEIIVLDDGMQSSFLNKDLCIMVIDGKMGFGNNLLFPAGPLRESVKSALKKSDIIFGIESLDLATEKTDIPKFILKKRYILSLKEATVNDKFLAFSGLANNDKFFTSLLENKINVIKKISFKDHHIYKESDIKTLETEGLKLITTEKDIVKIKDNAKISVLQIELFPENKNTEEKIKKLLINLLTTRQKPRRFS